MQSSVDGNDLAGCLAETITYEKEVGLRLIGGRDRCSGERPIGIELSQFVHERFGLLILRVSDFVFGK